MIVSIARQNHLLPNEAAGRRKHVDPVHRKVAQHGQSDGLISHVSMVQIHLLRLTSHEV